MLRSNQLLQNSPRQMHHPQPVTEPGMGGTGIWEPATTGMSPGNENATMKRYLAGDYVT